MRQKLDPSDPVEAAHVAAGGTPDPLPPTAHELGIKSIRVKWGDETIQPVQFNGLHVGEIEVESSILPGETLEEAHARIFEVLERIGQKQFETKLKGFVTRMSTAQRAARGGK